MLHGLFSFGAAGGRTGWPGRPLLMLRSSIPFPGVVGIRRPFGARRIPRASEVAGTQSPALHPRNPGLAPARPAGRLGIHPAGAPGGDAHVGHAPAWPDGLRLVIGAGLPMRGRADIRAGAAIIGIRVIGRRAGPVIAGRRGRIVILGEFDPAAGDCGRSAPVWWRVARRPPPPRAAQESAYRRPWRLLLQHLDDKHGFHVIRNFVGHGIGRRMHEDPQVYNYGKRGRGLELREGMVLAIEPMLCEIGPKLRRASSGPAGTE